MTSLHRTPGLPSLLAFTVGTVLLAALVLAGMVSLSTVLLLSLLTGCVAPHLARHLAHPLTTAGTGPAPTGPAERRATSEDSDHEL